MWDSSDRAEATGIGNAAERSTENVRALCNVKRLVSLLGIMNSQQHSVPRDAEFMAPVRLHEEQRWVGLRTALPKASSMFRGCPPHPCIKTSLDYSSQEPRCSSCDSLSSILPSLKPCCQKRSDKLMHFEKFNQWHFQRELVLTENKASEQRWNKVPDLTLYSGVWQTKRQVFFLFSINDLIFPLQLSLPHHT